VSKVKFAALLLLPNPTTFSSAFVIVK